MDGIESLSEWVVEIELLVGSWDLFDFFEGFLKKNSFLSLFSFLSNILFYILFSSEVFSFFFFSYFVNLLFQIVVIRILSFSVCLGKQMG